MPRNSVADFVRSFNMVYDTTNNVGRDFALAKVARAEETPFELQGPGPESEGGQALTGKGVTFLGKTYDKPLTDDQRQAARNAAMAGVFEQFGDPERAESLRQRAKQGVLADLQIKGAERQAKLNEQSDKDDELFRNIENQVGEAVKVRLTNPDGTVRPMTNDDHLFAGQLRATQLVTAGKIKEAGALARDNMRLATEQIQLQTAEREQAIKRVTGLLATGGDPTAAVAEFYKTYVPDGAQIKRITTDPKTGAITIERAGVDGQPLSPQVLKGGIRELAAGIQSFANPAALETFAHNQFYRDIQERQLRNAERNTSLNAAQIKRANDLADAARNAGAALYLETNPNATPTQVEAVRAGVIPAVPQADANAPAEVKLAQALVKSGFAPDMRSALDMAITKKPMSAQERYFELSKPQGGIVPSAEDVGRVMAEVYGPEWKDKIKAPRAASAPGAAPAAPNLPKINSQAEYAKLPSGARFVDPNGQVRVKP